MLRLWQMTGLKLRMRGYKSMGLSVPLVMMTDWNLVNTGFMASDASRHASWMTGSLTVGIRSSNGSVMICTAFARVQKCSQSAATGNQTVAKIEGSVLVETTEMHGMSRLHRVCTP